MALPRTSAWRQRFPIVVLLVVTAAAGVFAANGMEPAGSVGPDRETQESVTLARMPGSINDTVSRVAFDIGGDGLRVADVWFGRQPYELTDGTRILQTESYRGDVFVRQIMEHPHAASTVVVFPGLSEAPFRVASRFLTMEGIAFLNRQKTLRLLAVGPDGALHEYVPASSTESVELTALQARLMDGSLAGQSAAQLFGAYEHFGVARASETGAVAGGEARAVPLMVVTEGRSAPVVISGEDMRRLLNGRDGTLLTLLDGQGLVVVEKIERAIRAKVASSPEIGNDVIERLNELLNDLAARLGRTDLWLSLFDNGIEAVAEANRLLGDIDALIGTDTKRIFRIGLTRIHDLFLEQIPAAVEALYRSAAEAEAEAEDPDPAAIQAAAAAAAVASVRGAPAGSLILVEAGGDIATELIRASLDRSDFNVVLMSDAPAEEEADVQGVSNLTSAVSQAAHGVFDAVSISGAAGRAPKFGRHDLLASLDLALSALTMEPDSAIVIQQPLDVQKTLVGLAIREDTGDPQVDFYVLDAGSPSEFAAAVDRLAADESAAGLTARQKAVLERWAVTARTGLEL